MADRTSKPKGPSGESILCGARRRQGGSCGQLAMTNGRCYLHGGLSTGPRTAEGLERSRTASITHGGRSQAIRELRATVRELKAQARQLKEIV